MSQQGGVRFGDATRTDKIRPEKLKKRRKLGDVQNVISGGNMITVPISKPRRIKEEAEREVRVKAGTTESVLKRKKHHLMLPS